MIGRLRHEIILQKPNPQTNAYNEDVPGELWTDVAKVWASIEPTKGNEFEVAEQMIGARYTHAIELLGKETFLYGGGGVTFAQADLMVGGDTTAGNGVGYWYGAGAYWEVAENLTFGIDAKWSHVDVDMGKWGSSDVGGASLGVSVGVKF